VNLLPNQPLQWTASKRRSASLRAAYAAPERRRWASMRASLLFGASLLVSSGHVFAQSVSRPEISPLQTRITELAVLGAKAGHNVTLDFSHESVKQFDLMLGPLHEKQKQKFAEPYEIRGAAMQCAAYIVTTIEKNTEKGRWERDHPIKGPDSFPFYWRRVAIFPYEWCMKRIDFGARESIWSKYQNTVLKQIR
jgi:hypothetical protein